MSEAENALAEPIADMRFSLPASPSVPVLLLLSAAGAEVRRAGDHKIGEQPGGVRTWGPCPKGTVGGVLKGTLGNGVVALTPGQ